LPDRIYVLRRPSKALGHVTGYVRRSGGIWVAHPTALTTVTAYHPTVKFQAVGRVVHFEDLRGSQTLLPVDSWVPVLYDSRDPSKAMIDESFWNLIPCAPITIAGFLLLLKALRCGPSFHLARMQCDEEADAC